MRNKMKNEIKTIAAAINQFNDVLGFCETPAPSGSGFRYSDTDNKLIGGNYITIGTCRITRAKKVMESERFIMNERRIIIL